MKNVRIGSFKFNIGEAKSELEEIDAEKILLQLPDGLKPEIFDFAKIFDQDVTVWGGTCYGACDLPKEIGEYDALVHIGHSEIPNLEVNYPVIYLPGKNVTFQKLPEKILDKLEGKVALYATIQYIHRLEDIEEQLLENDIKPVIGKGDDRVKYPGQILGCNYSVQVKDADTHLYIGTGKFHPLGLAFSLDQNVWTFNPSSGEISKIDQKDWDQFKRNRFGSISKAKNCKRFGVIVSNKKGQSRFSLARQLVKMGEKEGLNVVLIEMDEVSEKSIKNMQLDCLVNTACPRISLDDSERFDFTILTPDEYEVVLEKEKWENMSIDEIK